MSTENNGVTLHHSIKGDPAEGAPVTDIGADFMAGFNEGEEAPPAAPAATPGADGTPPPDGNGGAPPQPAGDGTQQGVDTPGNGAQVSPQPQGLDLSALPEDLRQHVESLQAEKQRLEETAAQQARDFEALKGRVAPVQQQLERAQQQLAAQGRQQAPPQQPQPRQAAPATAATTALTAQFETAEWKEYKRLYPEDAALHERNQLAIAASMDRRFGSLEAAVADTFQRVGRVEHERVEAIKRAEVAELDRAHPDWRQLNESDEFWDWFNTKSALFGFRDEADMRTRMNNRSFVSSVLDLYKAGMQPAPVTQPAQPAAQPATPAAPAARAAAAPSATILLAASPRGAGGGIRPVAGGGVADPGDAFLAGYNSTD